MDRADRMNRLHDRHDRVRAMEFRRAKLEDILAIGNGAVSRLAAEES